MPSPFGPWEDLVDLATEGLFAAALLAGAAALWWTGEHGGSIKAHSEGRGRGARFVLRLPVRAPAVRPGTAPAWVPT